MSELSWIPKQSSSDGKVETEKVCSQPTAAFPVHNSLIALLGEGRKHRQWWGNLFVIFPEAKMVNSQWHTIITLTLFESQVFEASLMWTSNHNFITFFLALRVSL